MCVQTLSIHVLGSGHFFYIKQNTAYEMRISSWSSDVCSSYLLRFDAGFAGHLVGCVQQVGHLLDIRGDKAGHHALGVDEIGSASCRERVCPYVSISVAAVSIQKTRRRLAHRRYHMTQCFTDTLKDYVTLCMKESIN